MKRLSFFNRIIYGFNSVVALTLLLACVVPFTTIASLFFLSLAVPLLVVLNIVFLVYWLLFKRRLIWLSLVVLVAGYFILGSFVVFNGKAENNSEEGLKIMSFNAQQFNAMNSIHATDVGGQIVDFIKEEDPGVICFQEYRGSWGKKFKQYPFISQTPYEEHKSTQSILSKYPIISEGSLNLPNTINNIIYADIVYKEDTIRFYNLHLESLKVRPWNIKREESDKLFKRLRSSFSMQQEQAEILVEHAKGSPYKNIICGDFNNTQYSSVYRTIREGLKDSFEEKGFGYGRTINFWRFPLRIDFVLTDPAFDILMHKNYNVGLSDHEPVMVSLKVGSNE
ncbi:endonuclease/exonuclease/phosphatase family protein [Maribacter sp. MMG018]|uniref:endonuclease/exonuclease/phosphatase family protein n=1 Tax=Maribacter sp. MMG018 TaxID=2822688 RepID=UPI001B36DF7B|nr:endonuclease/exonuclease/phosphatase family protein [Maribacter sp. MMG018]MBQ4915711.1 endonuclease/exonuclease/phosphatase family protein [Maribacter sp. MMG018]